MQESFSMAQRYQKAAAIASGNTYSLPGQPTVMQGICKKFNRNEIIKGNRPQGYFPDGYMSGEKKENYCAPNEGYYTCDTHPPIEGKVLNYSSGRGYNFLPSIRKTAGNLNNFAGKVDNSKYGEYGSSYLKSAETFCPGTSNARMMGGSLNLDWASGTTDGVRKTNIQPFNPTRYPAGTA